MNRRVGLSRFQNSTQSQRNFQEFGQSLLLKRQRELSTQLSLFKSILLNFLKEHKEELSSDLKFRNEFIAICSKVGIDPLEIYDKDNVGSNEGVNEFYYELCIRLIEFSNSLKDINGGLMPIDEFLTHYSKLNITEGDIERVIKLLSESLKNPNFQLITIGKIKYLKNFQNVITQDQNKVLEIVNDIGYVTVGLLRDNLRWDKLKVREILNELVLNGYLWVDSQDPEGTSYWDPSWINKQ